MKYSVSSFLMIVDHILFELKILEVFQVVITKETKEWVLTEQRNPQNPINMDKISVD